MNKHKERKIIYDIVPPHARMRAVVHDVVVPASRGTYRMALAVQKKILAGTLALLLVLMHAQAFVAFEAHVVDVRADIIRIDPPIISPASGEYPGAIDVVITSDDTDATHIFYSVTPGEDDNAAPDPNCSGSYPGGVKPLASFVLEDNAVVKAVACDGVGPDAHGSLIALASYTFPERYAGVQGHKFHDTNKNEQFDPGIDFPVEGWRMYLLNMDDTVASTTVTDASGFYYFKGVPVGAYVIKEEERLGWKHVTPADFPVTVDTGKEKLVYDFYNYDTGFACTPMDVKFPYMLAVQAAGQISEHNDDVALGSNVAVNGDVRSNDDIERTTNASNVLINGNATSSSDIDAGITVTGLTLKNAPTASLPDIMIPEWRDRAHDGGIVNGSFIFPNNTVGLELGPVEISGNVSFGSSNAASIKGPLYIHGNLTIGSNTTITEDASFGDQFVPIIVDGTITIGSNVSFVGSGARGAFLLVSTHAAVPGDDAAIMTSSNNSDLGDVVLYASEGDIHIRSNRVILAAFAAHGTGEDTDANAAVRLDSNVAVNWRPLPETISCGVRQPYETTSHIVINEFMPNPTGADDAVRPGGEWVELFNPTAASVDVDGWVLYDSDNTHELVISSANTSTGDTTLSPGGFLVMYRDGDGDFALNNSSGDSVRLFSDEIGLGGILVDSYTYSVNAPENKSFARIPDGSSNWIDPDPTPGASNMMFVLDADGDEMDSDRAFEESYKPELYIEPRPKKEDAEDAVIADHTEEEVVEEKAKVEEPPAAEVETTDDTVGDGDGSDDTSISDANDTATSTVSTIETDAANTGKEAKSEDAGGDATDVGAMNADSSSSDAAVAEPEKKNDNTKQETVTEAVQDAGSTDSVSASDDSTQNSEDTASAE